MYLVELLLTGLEGMFLHYLMWCCLQRTNCNPILCRCHASVMDFNCQILHPKVDPAQDLGDFAVGLVDVGVA